MRYAGLFLSLLIAGVAASGCAGGVPEADLILTGGRVYTLDWSDPGADGTPARDAPWGPEGWYPQAEAVAVAGGRILYVGSRGGAMRHRGEGTRVVELAGATVLPGLIDSHVHIEELAQNLSRIDLRGLETVEAIVARLREGAGGIPPGEWIVGYGWDEGNWADRYPDHTALTRAFPENPVLVDGLHGFGVWANRRALTAAGVTRGTPDPVGGRILRDARGEPSGVLVNQGVNLLRTAVPPPTPEQLIRTLRTALMQMARDGYVCIHQAGTRRDLMTALETMEARGELPIRVYAMVSTRDGPLTREWIARGPDRDDDSMLLVKCVKAYDDGSLGSRGARLLEDYTDQPGQRGVSGSDYGFDEELVAAAVRAGFQAAIHAIGDAGNREVLDFYERVITSAPETRARRHRIEHAQVVHPDDFLRFGQLGLIASMQPCQTVEDKAWIEDRIGPERCRGAFAWRTMRVAGAGLSFNSDLPGSDHSIFYGLHAAITRRDKERQPEGGWYPHQAVTPEEAVRAWTVWAAYAGFQERVTGVLRPGMFADITVMDIDPFVLGDTAPERILDGRIMMTIVNGEVLFEAER